VATGYVPFEANTLTAAMHKHIYVAPPKPRDVQPDVSVELEDVILRCLAKAPKDRFASAAELSAALASIIRSFAPPPQTDKWEAPAKPIAVRTRNIEAALDKKELTITPGQPVVCKFSVLNAGPVVEHISFAVEGVPPE